MFQDKTLVCRDCNAEFIWSAGEQEFFAQKGFDRAPTRCPECRKKRRGDKPGGPSTPKQLYDITCTKCGKQGQVPFQPKTANILCADCFRAQHPAAAPAGDAPAPVAAPAPADQPPPVA